MTDLLQASLSEVRGKLARREVSAEAVVKASLERIAASEPTIHALITVHGQALEGARALDAQGPDPSKPLWGVPVTVKDAIATKGLRTTAGSKILGDFTPFYDAFVVEKLKAAGAVIVGKNNMDEFAMGSSTENSAFGPTRNPRDPERIPGGSSGAACQCYASLGTDTGGSIRQPAALCGCVGLKPTYGRVSRYGVIAYGSSLDQVGPLTRTVEDAAIMLSVIAGHDKRDSTSSPRPVDAYALSRSDLKGVRLGVPREFMAEGLDGPVAAACRDALDRARDHAADDIPLARRIKHDDRHDGKHQHRHHRPPVHSAVAAFQVLDHDRNRLVFFQIQHQIRQQIIIPDPHRLQNRHRDRRGFQDREYHPKKSLQRRTAVYHGGLLDL